MSIPAPGRGSHYRELNARQQRFVDGIMQCKTQKQAAIDAGYSPKTADKTGSTLVRKPGVIAALVEARGPEIASVDEIQRFWSASMREKRQTPLPGDKEAPFKPLEGAEPKDRIRASELLAKSFGALSVVHNHKGSVAVEHTIETSTKDWPLELAEEHADMCERFAKEEAALVARAKAHKEIEDG